MADQEITLDQFIPAMAKFLAFPSADPSALPHAICRYVPDPAGGTLIDTYLEYLSQHDPSLRAATVLWQLPEDIKPKSDTYLARSFLTQIGQTPAAREESFSLLAQLKMYFRKHRVRLLIIKGWD